MDANLPDGIWLFYLSENAGALVQRFRYVAVYVVFTAGATIVWLIAPLSDQEVKL